MILMEVTSTDEEGEDSKGNSAQSRNERVRPLNGEQEIISLISYGFTPSSDPTTPLRAVAASMLWLASRTRTPRTGEKVVPRTR
jgi:hypothetical protein